MKDRDIELLGDRVLVRVTQQGKTAGGIIVPDDVKRTDAVVVAVGPGRVLDTGARIPCQVKPGDPVILDEKVAGVLVPSDHDDPPGVRYAIIYERQIAAVERIREGAARALSASPRIVS